MLKSCPRLRRRPDSRWVLLGLCGMCLLASGCRSTEKTMYPSQNRDWEPLYSRVATAEFAGNQVTLRNVRSCQYLDNETYIPNWYDKQFRVSDVRAVDFVVMPFPKTPSLAHTLVSFEIDRGSEPPDYLAVSVETRKERGETYAAWKGSARQYELIYVVADERDVIGSQTNINNRDVYLYRSTATPEKAQRLFIDIMGRVNGLAAAPEFYDTLTNNCTNNIVRHINRIEPGRVTSDLRVLLPGLSDRLAYDAGLIQSHGTFERTKAKAYITTRAQHSGSNDNFSQAIRTAERPRAGAKR